MIGLGAPPVAALDVLVVGALSPGYDITTRTVSRLAVPGMPAAAAVDVAIALVALAWLAVAFGLGPGALIGRLALAAAGAAFIGPRPFTSTRRRRL